MPSTTTTAMIRSGDGPSVGPTASSGNGMGRPDGASGGGSYAPGSPGVPGPWPHPAASGGVAAARGGAVCP